jgi:hypothetical protein
VELVVLQVDQPQYLLQDNQAVQVADWELLQRAAYHKQVVFLMELKAIQAVEEVVEIVPEAVAVVQVPLAQQ